MESFLKKKYVGFQTSVIRWFESYLLNRNFLVYIDNVFLSDWNFKVQCTRRSVVGPLHFLLYVNNLPQSLSEAGTYLYADDTCIFYQYEDVKKNPENVLNKEFSSIRQWFIDNKL